LAVVIAGLDQVTRNPWNDVTPAFAYDDENVKIYTRVSSLREKRPTREADMHGPKGALFIAVQADIRGGPVDHA
jgi:uncharacterized SAM-dependent methyltransferase